MPYNPKSIADVGTTLVNLLLASPTAGFGTGDVGLYSIGEVPETSLPKLTLFLYHMNEDPSYVNREPERLGNGVIREPWLALELHYMVIPNSTKTATAADRALEEHRWIEEAMRTFRSNAILRDPVLWGGLAGKEYEIRITLNPVPLTDLTNIWQAMQTRPFKLAVCYRVGPVFIETDDSSTVSRVSSVSMGGFI